MSACFPLSPPTSHRLPFSKQPEEPISKIIFLTQNYLSVFSFDLPSHSGRDGEFSPLPTGFLISFLATVFLLPCYSRYATTSGLFAHVIFSIYNTLPTKNSSPFPSFKFLLKWHLHREVFPEFPVQNNPCCHSLTTYSVFLFFLALHIAWYSCRLIFVYCLSPPTKI